MRTTLLYTTLILLFTACADQSSSPEVSQENTMSEDGKLESIPNPGSNGAMKPSDKIDFQSRKFIWTANLEYQVAELDKATEQVQNWCKEHEAFVTNMEFQTNNYRKMNTLEIRVENAQFNALIKRFRGQAKFIQQFNISSQDVTEEYVDIESRLRTKREVRDRYIEVLRNKAGTVKEILEAEQAIRVITEEIEVIEGRLRFLNDQVSYSTIRLTMFQKVEFKENPELYEKSYGTELSEGASAGWFFIKQLFLGIVTLWPLWIVLFLGLWKGRWMWRKLFGATVSK